MQEKQNNAQIQHALAKMLAISLLGQLKALNLKGLFQFGYNAGRYAELSGRGREVWDNLKDSVEQEDWGAVNAQVNKWMDEFEERFMEPEEKSDATR